MQAAALLAANPKPALDDVMETMSGNICRCGCYQRIAEAIALASTGA
jgi:isoquinoline 1-oxidoreductase alpha subunit